MVGKKKKKERGRGGEQNKAAEGQVDVEHLSLADTSGTHLQTQVHAEQQPRADRRA